MTEEMLLLIGDSLICFHWVPCQYMKDTEKLYVTCAHVSICEVLYKNMEKWISDWSSSFFVFQEVARWSNERLLKSLFGCLQIKAVHEKWNLILISIDKFCNWVTFDKDWSSLIEYYFQFKFAIGMDLMDIWCWQFCYLNLYVVVIFLKLFSILLQPGQEDRILLYSFAVFIIKITNQLYNRLGF